MFDLNFWIEEIRVLKVGGNFFYEKGKEIKAEINEKTNKLRKWIKEGQTTGNKFRDFAIARYGLPDNLTEIETIYSDIEKRAQEHSGEFILIATSIDIDKSYCALYLGILNNSALILDPKNGKCGLPVNGYIFCHSSLPEDVKKIFKKNTILPLLPIQNVSDHRIQKMTQKIFIGDNEIKKWSAEQTANYSAFFQKAAQFFGRSPI